MKNKFGSGVKKIQQIWILAVLLKKLELNTKLVNNNYEFKEKPCKILYNEKST